MNFIYFWSPNGHCLVHVSPSLNRFVVHFNPLIIRVSQTCYFSNLSELNSVFMFVAVQAYDPVIAQNT